MTCGEVEEKEEIEEKEYTVAEAGRKGGNKVKELYGREFFVRIGRKGGCSVRDKFGEEYFSRIGKMGGQK